MLEGAGIEYPGVERRAEGFAATSPLPSRRNQAILMADSPFSPRKDTPMPNIAKVLKEEISRIARKEARAAVAPVRKPSVRLRRDVAGLKKRMAVMEQGMRRLQGLLSKLESSQPEPALTPAARPGSRPRASSPAAEAAVERE